eukprot:TRINITY_DN22379_c0_g1_i2.p1 TRINITY_DN22379_c0_g1~~TRINITY_DN22379_c0_g1_i2.p1  ORF type:complete len:350 (-),score=57.41 TRINITY_DN22379_c0_g1_i2:79-1128(-)
MAVPPTAHDPLLTRADLVFQKQTKQRAAAAGAAATPVQDAFVQVVIPVLGFLITLSAVYGLYSYHPWWLSAYFLLSGLLLVFLLRSSSASAGLRAAAAPIALAVAAGLLVGLWIYYTQWVYYIRYRDLARHTNVQGSQPAAAFADTGIVTFTADTQVDVTRAVGYQSAVAGALLCVAPVVDSTMAPTDQISFFAVGIGCCDWRSSFRCGDVGDPSAKSGLLALDAPMLVSPPMAWAVEDAALNEAFAEALRLQRATFGTPVAAQTRFLRWVRDPVWTRDDYWRAGWREGALWMLVLFVVLSGFAGAGSAALMLMQRLLGGRAGAGAGGQGPLTLENLKRARRLSAVGSA